MAGLSAAKARAALHRAARTLGFDIVRASNLAISDFARRRAIWLERRGVSAVFDVGANRGQYALELRRSGYEGRIISFEPLQDEFVRLQAASASDPRWACAQQAIGDRCEDAGLLHVSAYSESSSMLPMTSRHTDALPISAYTRSESVPLATIDSLFASFTDANDISWLKLDVQGMEIDVLRGATNSLPMFGAVEAELSLVELYEGQALALSLIAELEQSGFKLAAVSEAFRDPRTYETLQLNGIFLRESPR
jgi:FkbM family methyltransferase